MILIVCQRVILIYFSAKSEMVARLRGHDRFFCHVRRKLSQPLHFASWSEKAHRSPDKLELFSYKNGICRALRLFALLCYYYHYERLRGDYGSISEII
jgi:hypothetical protein